MKSSSLPPSGLLQPLPLPSLVFEGIPMDFITGLPLSQGKSVIMVVVDRLTKYGHFLALPPHFTSAIVANVFVSEVVCLHGIPVEIVPDRDTHFMTDFWCELHHLKGTTLAMSTTYHPQSDGQTEALNRCLEMYLSCYVSDFSKTWLTMLSWAEYSKYSSGHSLLDAFLVQRDEVLQTLKVNLLKAQARMKTFSDQHRRHMGFNEVRWEGFDAAAATWEDKDQFLKSFLTLNLADKVSANGEGNVVKDIEATAAMEPIAAVRSGSQIKKRPAKYEDFVLNPRQRK
ncbi:hypothetical protein F3Y22_tig00116965pilonHSYRG00306 [Hibiscus syriacus]|uniref:Integrase catalytic domain-containing protein n=1 Tax=Hibiscus syriacus TaxID=106335 RepID=A0A6A2WIE2_HIBSY|nr:hypothetical protein F3Y22_tig00116965pilonHSYRG00306 [Hibiscus syriacus]